MKLSAKAQGITPSLTLAITAKAAQMEKEGQDVIGFGAGEPDFATPENIRDAAKGMLDKGFVRYTDAGGMVELKRAICQKLLRENGLAYEPSQIVVSNGAKHSLFNAFQVLLDPGDEVIIPSPYWLTYPELVRMADGVPVFVETDPDRGFQLDLPAIEAAITPRTKVLLVNNPCNPTGAVYPESDLAELASLAVAHDLAIVSDEIYERMCYVSPAPPSIAALGEAVKERTVVVNGVSKTYAMTGWRIGYTASPLAVAKAMAGYQSHATSNANTIAQVASIEALKGSQDQVNDMISIFAQRRDRIVDRVNSIPGLSCARPDGAFYVMVDVGGALGRSFGGQTIGSAMDFARLLLEGVKVAVVPGECFGADRYVRLSYAMDEQRIDSGLERIREFMEALQ